MAHVELKTPRLALRSPLPDDIQAWTALLQEPAVARFWPGYDRKRVRTELFTAAGVTVLTLVGRAEAGDQRAAGTVLGAIQSARAQGVQALHLQVRPENAAAQRLYLGAGFRSTTRMFLSKSLGREG